MKPLPLGTRGCQDVPQTRALHVLKYTEKDLGENSLSSSARKQIKVLSWQKSGLTSGRTYGRAAGISSRQSNINTYITAACRWWSDNSAMCWGKAGQAATAPGVARLSGNPAYRAAEALQYDSS